MERAPLASDIAVVGMACRFPCAPNVNEIWRLVRDGQVAFEEISDQRWKHSSFYSSDSRAVDKTNATKGAFIERVDEFAALHFGLAPRRLQVTDPQHRLLIEAVHDALQDAGYDKRPFDRINTGVFIGASVSEYKDLLTSRLRAQSIVDGTFGDALSSNEAEALRSAVGDLAPARAFTIAGSLLNMMAATVSQVFDLSGPSFTLDAACSSALVAIHEAVVHLRAEQCHVAIAGGIYLNFTPDNLVGFSRIQAVSPSGACRPFDARADGFVMGEGVGVVVLKRLADARRDGDRIYAVVCGTGCNNDGRSEGPMTPRAEGQIDAMKRAHRDASNFPIETIEFVETHGTATAVGDVVEVSALRSFFESCAGRELTEPFCYLGSIKANVGHTMSAAGVAGFIKAVLALHKGIIPPQPSIDVLNPRLGLERSPFRIANAALPWKRSAAHPRRAAVSSFGFGGTNAHVLLEEAPGPPAVSTEREELFLVSAPTNELLSLHLLELASNVEEHSLAPASVAYTLAARALFDARKAFVARGRQELTRKLRQAAEFSPTAPYSGRQRLAFLFPGDGSSTEGTLEDLFDRFPSFRARVVELYNGATGLYGSSWVDPLCSNGNLWAGSIPHQLFGQPVCRVAAVASGIALAELLETCGIKPDVVIGHGFGEIAAAAAAGMLSARDAVSFVANWGTQADRSDSDADIGSEMRKTLVAQTAAPFFPVVSCITGAPYTCVDEAMEIWARLATAPADYARGLRTCDAQLFVQMGAIDPILTLARGASTAAASDFFSLAPMEGSDGGRMLLETIGHLFSLGIPVDARPLMQGPDHMLTTLPPTPLERQSYWAIERSDRIPRRPAEVASRRPDTPDDLLMLFRQSLDLLLGQQEVMKIQAASLQALAEGAATSKAALPPPNEEHADRGAVPRAHSHSTQPHGTLRDEIGSRVLAWVARISGFDPSDLRLTQAVTGELGFDSLMLIDLDVEIAKAWPAVGGLSRDVLTPQTTVQDIVGHIVRALESTSENQAETSEKALTSAKRYLPKIIPVLQNEPSLVGQNNAHILNDKCPPSETYKFDKFPEYRDLKERLHLAELQGILNPYFRVHDNICNHITQMDGGVMINFSSYNYLDNSGDPVVSAAAKDAIEVYGTSVSASRVASGERPLHAILEKELACFLDTEDCLVFTSGHATNVTVIGHVVGAEDLIVHDELAHDSIVQGAKLAGAQRRPFPHNDCEALERMLNSMRGHYRRVLICIEGAYSMDGDIPDLPKIVNIKKRHHTLLLVDEAHSIGVVGRTGRGIGEYYDVSRCDVDLWMGTLSKSFASCGGYICGSHALIEYLKYTAPGFVYSVGISPPNAAAALAALRQTIAYPERVRRLQLQSKQFVELLKARGIDTGRSKDTAVVPAIIGNSLLCLRLADRLRLNGINVQPILYPAVPESAARLRFFISCAHTDDQLTTTADVLIKEIETLRQSTSLVSEPIIVR